MPETDSGSDSGSAIVRNLQNEKANANATGTGTVAAPLAGPVSEAVGRVASDGPA